MKYDFDIAVIGAGPAGSALSFLLAESGLNVCLIEKKDFPRETLCGEFLSREVIRFLKYNNFFEEFLALDPNEIYKFLLFTKKGYKLNAELGFKAFGLSRGAFDNFLLKKVKEKKVTIYQPAAVDEIVQIDDYVELKINDDNKSITIRCKYAAAAYGKRNILDKKINRNFLEYKSRMNGLKIHLHKDKFKNLNEDEISIFSSNGIYCGINFIDNNHVTLCFLHDRKMRDDISAKDEIEYLQEENKYFRNIFSEDISAEINSADIYGAGNIHFGKKDLVIGRIFFLGDAARVIAPFTGDGIGMAIQSAEILSKIILRNIDVSPMQREYISAWKKIFGKRLLIAYWSQKLLLNDRLHFFPRILFKLYPELINYVIGLTRAERKKYS